MSIYNEENFEHDKHKLANKNKRLAELKEQVGTTQLENKLYQRLITDYIQCTTKFVGSFAYAPVLAK